MVERPDAPRVALQRADVGDAAPPEHESVRSALASVRTRPNDLKQILDASPEALIAFDGARRIHHANRAAEDFFGCAPGELEGASTESLLPERLRQPQPPPMVAVPDVMQVVLPGVRRDGTEFDVEWIVASVDAPSGPIFVMAVQDRAAMKRTIEKLRASEERFRLLVDEVRGYAIFTLDATGRISSWNVGAERILGWRATDILGKPYETFFTREDRDADVPSRHMSEVIRAGSQALTGWRVRKDGSRFPAETNMTALRAPNGELRGFAKITRDLTDKLQAEELERRLVAERARRAGAEEAERHARASEERLQRIQSLTIALSGATTARELATRMLDQSLPVLDADGGVFYQTSVGGDALELLEERGHRPGQLAEFARLPWDLRASATDAARDKRPLFLESVEDRLRAHPHLEGSILADGFGASVALPMMTQGVVSGVMVLRFRRERAFDANDRALLATLGELCSQALERSRLLAAERRARSEAEAASRAKDEFLAILGHELRNPLAPIVTALGLMKMRDREEDRAERTTIERQVVHLRRLVDDLLDVSRITQGKVELRRAHVELAQVVEMAMELSSVVLEQQRHHVTVAVPSEGLRVYVDPTRLAQAVANVVTNAAKYTPPGGHVDVAASRRDDQVVLSIRDDGTGISPETLPSVFELFTQERQSMDRSQGGLGLGLAIVKSLVTMHGGTVEAFSEGHGRGSTFTLRLPLSAAAPDAVVSTPTPSRAAPILRRRVLIVDDNEDAAELLADMLRAHGHTAMVAHDGPSALALAPTASPDVAVLDIGLPAMDGYELARRLRLLGGHVRLVALTGYGQESARARAREAGFDAHLTKPVDYEALSAALEGPPSSQRSS